MPAQIKIFTLSTCSHCTQAKHYLEEREIPYDSVSVDFMSGDDRTRVLETLRQLNPAITFPTIVIGDTVIVGFRRDEIDDALRKCDGGAGLQGSTWQQP
ncbi:glutaredoxin family protein [Solidesulfovibrio sp.]